MTYKTPPPQSSSTRLRMCKSLIKSDGIQKARVKADRQRRKTIGISIQVEEFDQGIQRVQRMMISLKERLSIKREHQFALPKTKENMAMLINSIEKEQKIDEIIPRGSRPSLRQAEKALSQVLKVQPKQLFKPLNCPSPSPRKPSNTPKQSPKISRRRDHDRKSL